MPTSPPPACCFDAEKDPWRCLSTPRRRPCPSFFPRCPLSFLCSLSRARLQAPSSAAAYPRRSAPPPAPPTSRGALPRRPLLPCNQNRAEMAGITAVRRRFPAGTDLAATEIHRRWPFFGRTDSTGDSPVSFWSGWALFPASLVPPSPPE
jgi:hypothetical protein